MEGNVIMLVFEVKNHSWPTIWSCSTNVYHITGLKLIRIQFLQKNKKDNYYNEYD